MTKHIIVGVDEAGRGPLAGPITAAVAALMPNYQLSTLNSKLLKGIKDSKKLSFRQREKWIRRLKPELRLVTIHASVGPRTIDRIGITRAAKLAVGRCLKKFEEKCFRQAPSYKILLDGSLYAPRTYQNQKTIIKGDEKVPLIAAASIVAKVARDKKMVRLSKKYPKYRIDIHKGYGTSLHCRLIKKHGLSKIHRKSFCTRLV